MSKKNQTLLFHNSLYKVKWVSLRASIILLLLWVVMLNHVNFFVGRIFCTFDAFSHVLGTFSAAGAIFRLSSHFSCSEGAN